jgi:hypothetical protein
MGAEHRYGGVALISLILMVVGANRARGQTVETDPSKVTLEQVLPGGPEAQVAYYRRLLLEFVAAKRAAGDRWRTMPFRPYVPVVKQIEAETRRLRQSLVEAGHLQDAALGDALLATVKQVDDAGCPLVATVALGHAFAAYASIADKQNGIPMDDAELELDFIRDGLRYELVATKALMDEASPLLRKPTDRERETVAGLRDRLGATREALEMARDDEWDRTGDAEVTTSLLDMEIDWDALLESLQERNVEAMITTLEPVLASFLEAAQAACRDPTKGIRLDSDVAAWRRVGATVRDAAAKLLTTVRAASTERMVPLPTFAGSEISEFELALASSARVAPLGLVLRHARMSPAYFYEHDVKHALLRAVFQEQPITSVEQFLEEEGRGSSQPSHHSRGTCSVTRPKRPSFRSTCMNSRTTRSSGAHAAECDSTGVRSWNERSPRPGSGGGTSVSRMSFNSRSTSGPTRSTLQRDPSPRVLS